VGKAEWAAIAAAIATVVTALIGSLAGLGEHAPGVVTALLISSPVIVMNVLLVGQLKILYSASTNREEDYAENIKNLAVWLEKSTDASLRIADGLSLQSTLSQWREEVAEAARVHGAAVIAKAVTDTAVAREVVNEAAKVAKEVKNDAQGPGEAVQ
jgi:hypothetical protein